MYSSLDFHGTIKAQSNFNDELAAEEIEAAIRGRGYDANRLLKVLTRINNTQRQMIRTPYRQKYNKDLYNELKRELSGEFEEVLLSLMETPTKYDAIQLNKSLKGMGTNETTLIEILCSRTNDELWAIKNQYRTQFGRNLEDDIIADTSGDFRDILVTLLQGNRDDNYTINTTKAREDARRLLGDEHKKSKPDKLAFRTILTSQNTRQLMKLFNEYENICGYSIEQGIEKCFGGDAERAYLAIVQCIKNTPIFFANQIYNSMKGIGTRNSDLIRAIVSRSEIDLAQISDEYRNLYKKPLVEAIKTECSGPYRDSLVLIVNGN